jgi:hypothetical protein
VQEIRDEYLSFFLNIAKLKAAIKSADFETEFKVNYLKGKDNGFSKDDLELLPGNYKVPGIKLKQDKKGKYDFENSKLIYETFKFLTPEEADDPRLWVYLSNCHFYDYTRERWLSSTSTEKVFETRILYEGAVRGVRTRNSISRLWWTAHLTYQKDAVGKEWDLTKAIFDVQDLQVSLLERNMGSYPLILKGFLDFYLRNKSKMKGKLIQCMVKELNNIGGVYSLSFLDEERIKEILKTLYNKYKD